MKWAQFEASAPRLARPAREKLIGPGVLLVGTVAYLRYQDPSGDQFVVLWPQGRGFVRRGTGGTSLGPAEPSGDLLGH
ncbi:MAG TPA: hypothetical protein VFI30_05180 [Nocardioidaceae bacterium]|nr:hypothetical protein [Nocardioidaceae bacterium]